MSEAGSSRAAGVSPFLAMEIFEQAQQMAAAGRDVLHLTVGEPDFPAPACARQACAEALARGETRYTHSLGRRDLREAICTYYGERYGVAVVPEQVLVTSGTSPALLLACAVFLERGDEVILSNPYYACYPSFLRFLDATPVAVATQEERGFQLDAELVASRVTARTRAVLLNSPANPTGCVMPPAELQAICALGVPVISDEIYHGLTYEGREASALEFSDEAFVLNGFSKRFAMTGFRLGYLIAPRRYGPALQRLHQNLFISANDFVQAAGLAALQEGVADAERMKAVFAQRRELVLQRLDELGVGSRARPTGAFYALADVRAYTDDSLGFARDMLETVGLGVTPGIDFGSNLEGFLRISYAYAWEQLDEGLRRLGRFLELRSRGRRPLR